MKSPSESTIKRQIMRFLRSLPKSDWKVSPPGSVAGKPDITGCLKGRFVAIEVKRPKARVTHLQQVKLAKLRNIGAAVGIARSVEGAKEILEYHGLY